MVDEINTTATATPVAAAPVPAPSAPSDPNAKSILLVVTYLIPIAFIYTMIKKGDNPYFVWHSKNAAAYLLVAIVLNIVFQVLWSVIPGMAGILSMLMNLAYLFLFVAVVYFGIVKGSWVGKQTPIPVLTGFAQKLPLEKWFKKGPAPTAAPTAVPPSAPAPTAPAEPAVPEAPSIEQTPPPSAPEAPIEAPKPEEPTPPTAQV